MPVVDEITDLRPLETKRPAPASRLSRKSRALTRPLLTAGELIAILQKADPASPVVIRGQYGGYDCVHDVTPRPLKLNVNSLDGFGPHEMPEDGEAADLVALAIECGWREPD